MKLQPAQKLLLSLVALFGLLGPNGVFLYYAMFRWDEFLTAMRHPVTVAFVSEAFLVMALLAIYVARKPWPWGWKSFIVLSLIGGLGFSIPTIVLLNAEHETP